MKINIISTGSSGNLYEILDKNGNAIIIEAGMPRQHYVKNCLCKEAPEMCIISHSHSDHAKYKNEFQAVIPTHLAQRENESFNFKAFGFPVKHGDVKTMTFLIKSLVENKFLFFATDIEYFDENGEITEICNTLKKLKVENFLIECNYNDYLFHLATEIQRQGCSRHFSDNDLIKFVKKTGAKNPKIITIHGSDRLCADTYTQKYISSKLITSTVKIGVGVKNGVKNIFII